MTILDGLILGTIQGLTEFLPVSSSAHLVFAEVLLNVKQPGVQFEVLVHAGTLLAVLVYFRKKLWALTTGLVGERSQESRRYVAGIIVATIPAAVAGVLLKDLFEAQFGDPFATSWQLVLSGVILLPIQFVKHGEKRITFFKALIIGIGQAVAIIPGISRSGSTIAPGVLMGVKPSEAAEFSFILSIPVIFGAIVLEIPKITAIASDLVLPYTLATICSFLFGLLAVYLVLDAIKRAKLIYFAIYCFAAGLFGMYLFS